MRLVVYSRKQSEYSTDTSEVIVNFDRASSFLEMFIRENAVQTLLFPLWSLEQHKQRERFVNCGYAQLELQDKTHTLVHDCRRS
ncbi:MAG: hypothetical protein ACK41E_01500 [Deinococcales bacterium]